MLREIENLLRTANKARGKDVDGNFIYYLKLRFLTPSLRGSKMSVMVHNLWRWNVFVPVLQNVIRLGFGQVESRLSQTI